MEHFWKGIKATIHEKVAVYGMGGMVALIFLALFGQLAVNVAGGLLTAWIQSTFELSNVPTIGVDLSWFGFWTWWAIGMFLCAVLIVIGAIRAGRKETAGGLTLSAMGTVSDSPPARLTPVPTVEIVEPSKTLEIPPTTRQPARRSGEPPPGMRLRSPANTILDRLRDFNPLDAILYEPDPYYDPDANKDTPKPPPLAEVSSTVDLPAQQRPRITIAYQRRAGSTAYLTITNRGEAITLQAKGQVNFLRKVRTATTTQHHNGWYQILWEGGHPTVDLPRNARARLEVAILLVQGGDWDLRGDLTIQGVWGGKQQAVVEISPFIGTRGQEGAVCLSVIIEPVDSPHASLKRGLCIQAPSGGGIRAAAKPYDVTGEPDDE